MRSAFAHKRGLYRRAILLLALNAMFFIAGCATNTRPAGTATADIQHWEGRLSLKIQSTPVESFSSGFELQGTEQAGTMALATPLGTTLGRMRWGPAGAELDNSGEVRKFESFSALAATVTGTDLPLSALFQWLSGTKSEAPGWQVDLSQFDQGRITARRITPLPEVDLRIILAR